MPRVAMPDPEEEETLELVKGAMDEIAAAAKENGVMISLTFTPYDDEK